MVPQPAVVSVLAPPMIAPLTLRFVPESVTVHVWIFFCSSRRRHTRCGRDWSSDVCSSDLNRLHKRDVEQAGFLVLKSPDMPSMLIEAGFISNPQEEKRLKDLAYQRKLAQQIANAIKDYFIENPPPNTTLSTNRSHSSTAYTIRRGDTLSEIARRKGVDIGELRKMNDLNNDVIRVGQRLRIPST